MFIYLMINIKSFNILHSPKVRWSSFVDICKKISLLKTKWICLFRKLDAILKQNETHLLINVLDLTGKVLTTQLLQSNLGTNSVQVKMETLDSGLYFIKFSDSNSSKLIKVVKL